MAKKRSSGEGHVKKLKNGSWRGQIMDGYRDDGKRNIVSFSGATKGECWIKFVTIGLSVKIKNWSRMPI